MQAMTTKKKLQWSSSPILSSSRDLAYFEVHEAVVARVVDAYDADLSSLLMGVVRLLQQVVPKKDFPQC